MFARRGVIISGAVPPFTNVEIRIGILVAKNEHSTVFDPGRQRRVNFGRQRLLSIIAQQQDAAIIQIMRHGDVFELDGCDRQALFEQGQGQTINIAQIADRSASVRRAGT